MFIQGLVRIGMILACVAPSMLCFTISGWLISHNVDRGWGWFLVIGALALDVPKRLLNLPEQCPTCRSRVSYQKPSPAYFEEIATSRIRP